MPLVRRALAQEPVPRPVPRFCAEGRIVPTVASLYGPPNPNGRERRGKQRDRPTMRRSSRRQRLFQRRRGACACGPRACTPGLVPKDPVAPGNANSAAHAARPAARNSGNYHGIGEFVPSVNRTLEWGVVIATFLSVLSIVPRHCARLNDFLHPESRKINAVLITPQLTTLPLRRAGSISPSLVHAFWALLHTHRHTPWTRTHARNHTYTHEQAPTHPHARTHTRAHTHTHTHTQ